MNFINASHHIPPPPPPNSHDDQTTVRVTNLSEDAQEADLRDLFGFFGSIRRIFLAKDKVTQHSKVGHDN